MAGLKKITEQNKWRRKCEAAARKADDEATNFGVDVDFDTDTRDDDAFEDDGCLHVRRYGLRAMFSIGQDTRGEDANAAIRTILSSLGMKKKIGKRTLVSEECEECEGDGYIACNEHFDHPCGNCEGTGFVEPEDYK